MIKMDGNRPQLNRNTAIYLVIANMIGVGVFTTSGYALQALGSPPRVLMAWLAGGVLAVCGALSYGLLARLTPQSGGEYAYLRNYVHPMAGFIAGWISVLIGFTMPLAAAAMGVQAYLKPWLPTGVAPQWVGTLVIAMAALVHGGRIQTGIRLQNSSVQIKIAAMVLLIMAGLLYLPPGPVAAQHPATAAAFATTIVWISFAYSGWNAAVYIAGEIRQPQANVQCSLLAGTLSVTALYLCLNTVFLYAAPYEQLAGKADIAAVAAEALGGEPLRLIMSALISLALLTSVLSLVLTGSRVLARMAQDGYLPGRLLARKPVAVIKYAVIGQCLLAVVVLWSSRLLDLLGYLGFILTLSSAITVITLFLPAARRRMVEENIGQTGMLYPWVPLFYSSTTLMIGLYMSWQQPLTAFVAVSTCLLLAGLYRFFFAKYDNAVNNPSGANTEP